MKLFILFVFCGVFACSTAQATFTIGGARAGAVFPLISGSLSRQSLLAHLEEGKELSYDDSHWKSDITPTAELYLYPNVQENSFFSYRFGVVYTRRSLSYNEEIVYDVSNGEGERFTDKLSLSITASSLEFPVMLIGALPSQNTIRPFAGVGASLGFFLDRSVASQRTQEAGTAEMMIGMRRYNPVQATLADVFVNFHGMIGAKMQLPTFAAGVEVRYTPTVFGSLISSIRLATGGRTMDIANLNSHIIAVSAFIEMPL